MEHHLKFSYYTLKSNKMDVEEYKRAMRAVGTIKPTTKACIIAVLNDTEEGKLDDVSVSTIGTPDSISTLTRVLSNVLQQQREGTK